MAVNNIHFLSALIILIGFVSISSTRHVTGEENEENYLATETIEKNFENNKLNITAFSGKWWVLAGVSPEYKIGRCMHYNIRPNNFGPNNFTIDANIVRYNSNTSMLWKVQSFLTGGYNFIGQWTTTRVIGTFNHTVYLSSPEYENYAAIIVKPNAKQIPNFAVILSRTNKTLSQEDFYKFKKLIHNANVNDDRFKEVDNTCQNITQIV